MKEGMQPVAEYGLSPEQYEEYMADPVELPEPETDWLAIARDAYESSDDYWGSSLRKQVEKNIDAFNSRHSSGSKYNQPSYKYRSKIYRPKTRSSVRRHEAAASAAYFSTTDVVTCTADNQGDDMAVVGAEIAENLVNTWLQAPELKWFQTCLGAYQDAMVQGAVISRQDWVYEERTMATDLPLDQLDQTDAQAVLDMSMTEQVEVVKDHPRVDLIPLENVRFDPAADWRDPVESSPYIVELLPMYRQDVKKRMEQADAKTGDPAWNKIDDEELDSGNQTGEMDSTRQRRNDGREDSKDIKHDHSDFDIIWIHRNIIRLDGEDHLYYTLGTTALLTDPVALDEVYPHGRPYRIGVCNLEAHKTVPAGTVEMTNGIQQEINDIVNQRLDNVKLVVNRRSFVRRGANIDVRGMTQSVPGGVTLVEDINKDIRYDAPPDVTSSSYAEQDRLNNDFDELAGAFSGSSVASNRQMNETVGGMQLMSEDANSVTEYQIKVFSETWLKPVMKQLLSLVRNYESDPQRLSAAANGADPNLAVQAIKAPFTIGLAVGFGATNPQKQVEKLAFGLNTVANFMPHMVQTLDAKAVLSEVFGALGYQDGSRFFDMDKAQDPQVAQLQQQLQQMQQMLEGKQLEQQTKLQVEQMRQQGNQQKYQTDLQREQIKQQGETQRQQSAQELEYQIAVLKQQIEYIDQQIKAEQNDIKRGELMVQRDAFDFSRKQKELEYAISERDRMSDILIRDQYGMAPGIDDQPGRG